jgi:hypothetical protein
MLSRSGDEDCTELNTDDVENEAEDLPASLLGEGVALGLHLVRDISPFRRTWATCINDGEQEVFVGRVIPNGASCRSHDDCLGGCV